MKKKFLKIILPVILLITLIPVAGLGIYCIYDGNKRTEYIQENYMKKSVDWRLGYLSEHAFCGIPQTNLKVLQENGFECGYSETYKQNYQPFFKPWAFDQFIYENKDMKITIDESSPFDTVYDKKQHKKYTIYTGINPENSKEANQKYREAMKVLDKATQKVDKDLSFQGFNVIAFIF